MSAPAIIDVTPMRLDSDGYRDAGAGHTITVEPERLTKSHDAISITDEQERLTRFHFRTTITVDPTKGLSRLQRRLLGTAYTMHVYGAQVHAGNIPDYVTPLGVFAIYGIAPNLASESQRFSRTSQVASAQAALSRAATRLVERKLLAWRAWRDCTRPGGYVLTDAGLRVGAREPVPVPQIERCARYFGMVGLCRWHRDESGTWVSTPWTSGKGGGYGFELVYEDCAAISRAIKGGG